MSVALVSGSAGLIGSEAVRHFAGLGLDVIGIDNDMRRYFFGEDGSTAWSLLRLTSELGDAYTHFDVDIRDREALDAGLQEVRRGHRGGDPHSRAAQPRLGRQGAVHRLRRQRRRHPQHAGEHPARTRSRRRSSTARPTRCTGTGPTRCRWSNWRPGTRSSPGTRTSRASPRTCRSTTASTRSSACRRWRPTSWCRSTAGTSA